MNRQLLKKIQKLKKERNEINSLDVSSNSELYKRLDFLNKQIAELEKLDSPSKIDIKSMNINDTEVDFG